MRWNDIAKELTTKSLTTASLAMMVGTFSGCIDHDINSIYTPPTDEDNSSVLKPVSDYFDFNTTSNVQISVDYGKDNSQVLLQFFSECPLVVNEETMSYDIQGTPLYTIFTDDNGQFNGTVQLPTCVEQLYVYSPYWGAPTVVEAQVKDGRVDVKTTGSSRSWQTASSRAVSNPSCKALKDNFYTLVDWNRYGAVTDYNGIYSDGPFSGAFINGIRRALWNGKDTKPNSLDNTKYTAGTDVTNTTILSEVVVDGATVTVESASITLNFLFEAGWYESSLGYYYYKSNECPSDPSQLKKFIIMPNVSIAYNAPYGVKGYDTYDSGLAPMQTNTSVQLLFEDENGQFTTNFPAGYTIGYFMISNGFNSANGTINLNGKVHNKNVNIYYSNCEWNDYSTKTKSNKRFISAKASDGTLIYGIEDGSDDTSYDDAVFTISSSPNIAIQTPGREDMDPIELELTTYPDIQRTYAYEDIWPTGGDYDMNDVVIQHRSEIEIDSQNNVYTVRDYYTPVQLPGSAKSHDAFAIQYGSQLGNSHTFPEGSVWEESTGSLIVFPSARNAYGKEFVVTRDFKGFITKSQLNRDENLMNPFIIVDYNPANTSRVEVHLPKLAATSKADFSLIDSADDAYYINKDGLHPFAICVPGLEYIPANEGIIINDHYPKFTNWVTSNGKSNTDWWKYPVE